MDYSNYNIEDFLADESFQQYCSGVDENSIAYWNNILEAQPDIKETFKEAVNLFSVLNTNQGNLHQQASRLEQRISQTENKELVPAVKLIQNYQWRAAAAIVLLLSAVSYFYLKQFEQKPIATTADQKVNEKPAFKNDIPPGGNKALLTLVDGTQIILDSVKNGVLASQGNTKILKLNSGQLVYQPRGQNEKAVINTISTPRGGQYQITLEDGSNVWLNAASSLKFPSTFTGNERTVELTGEGYFEVAKNASKPFRVKLNDATIEVLGTHFNINSYNDEESVKTTLLEGSVKVIKGNTTLMLNPGQQAQIINTGKIVLNKDVDITEVMAWKDGFFEFENMELPAIMRQVARWYNVSVSFPKVKTKERFGGRISRNLSLSNVLHLLETNNIHFKLEGSNITIVN